MTAGRYDASPSWSTNPTTPAKREALRTELERKQAATATLATQRLSMYMSRTTNRSRPLDYTKLATDPQVQDAVALSGQRPSVPSSRPDAASANCNSLRYARPQEYAQAAPQDGGRVYTATTLQDNWVEDRRDKQYTPGWHIKELRLNKLWDTTYTASFVNSHDPGYAAAAFKRNAVAKPPPTPTESESPSGERRHKDSDVIAYGREGFGCEPRQDHTTDSKRGGHWIGIAPVRDGESVATTAHGRREFLEFQKRTPTTDPKAKFLTGTKPGEVSQDYWTQRAISDHRASQLYASTWKSIYGRDFLNFGRAPLSNSQGWSIRRPQSGV
eukprot:CAMPEP_0202862158 /NCGR_PEP_ID=MMETSP1391-20130828/3299_1 /ASSEMBLY_ACC=CAM_ASM_000867 /TAXON_ID=1034604 /ORGANISM="Chlamydomonas leiostraca, Strain SAG 11-49" /LENGTH=327 /DNA_ID=CAMNT_0049541655 /DNA_START=125 /DNA_END=1105 /DNA_ORIENTATION=-